MPLGSSINASAVSAASDKFPSHSLMEKAQTILVVDPETDFLDWVQHQLGTPTTRVITATKADDGFKIFCRETPDLLITETHLFPSSGQDLLVKVKQRYPNAIPVLTSSFGPTP